MINASKIDGGKLVKLLLDDCCGNYNAWWRDVEFVENYMPPHPRPETKPTKVSIRCGGSFLRHLSFGCYIWDIHYGEDSEFYTQERALLELAKAPVPPWMVKQEAAK